MSNEIEPVKQPFKFGPKVGLAARKAQAATTEPELNPGDMPERLGIVFDDSISMAGQAMRDAHAGCEEFLRSCNPKTTAVAVYPMNANAIQLRTNLAMLAQLVNGITATGGTPMFETLGRIITEQLTRVILFSDGEPSDKYSKEEVLNRFVEKKLPIDTVYIGDGDSAVMREIAEQTGGVYIKLDSNKSNFRTAFKYLSPGFRAMLSDKSFVSRLENGEI